MTLTEKLALFYIVTLALLGHAYALASAVSKFGNPEWRITQWCAKHASDIRDLRNQVRELQ